MTMERGFGVHALEVWQKNSHVKLKEICLCEVAGGMMRTRYQLILVGQVLLEKNGYRKICLPDWERGVLFSFLHG